MFYTPEKFVEILLQKAETYGFLQSEALFGDGRSTEIQVLKGDVSQYESSAQLGLSFRGLYEGQMGYAYTEALDEDGLSFLLEQAKQNAEILEVDAEESIYGGEKEYRKINNYTPELDQIDYQELVEMTLALEKSILSFDERIVAVDYCVASASSGKELIQNTLGMKLKDQSNMLFFYASARCQLDEQVKTASGYWYGREKVAFDPAKLATEIAKKALGKLGSKSMPSGKYEVLLSKEVVCDILDAFAGIFSADAVQKGFSLLGDKINTMIACKNITLRDDAIVQGSITQTAFDSEGVSTKNLALIENGILKGLLHNRKTAQKAGTDSTGNGFRGYKGSLSVGTKNFYLTAGDSSFDEMLTEINNGIYITEVSGLHAGTNFVSGDFSLLGEGFLIENGKLTRPVEQITIADNFYGMLKKVEKIGDTLLFQAPSGAGSTGAPDLYVSDISISGE